MKKIYSKNSVGYCTTGILIAIGLSSLVYGGFNTEVIKNPSFFAITGSALMGGAIAMVGIIKQRETARSKNTIDLEASIEDNRYDEAFTTVYKLVTNRDNISVASWADDDKQSSPEAAAIKQVLNTWERASNGVRKKVYDNHFLYEIYGSHVLNIHEHLMPFMLKVRQERQPKAYQNFFVLAENWRDTRNLESLNYKQRLTTRFKIKRKADKSEPRS